ncbi:helix-turn-helix domain-containing protein [Saccharopolyspora erythraea]|uniref:PucR family transcriptional regulator n=1 Tax=Saccharopolyspora erythraea TaxID=1836 RepID=UPI001BA8A0E6|nr:helix-turn-helix domain-containing protein [Saccharopolyspora erythraea]QUH01851.1 helix-turn-helix domain-containing protein [Saccharopolyspora erythraea]
MQRTDLGDLSARVMSQLSHLADYALALTAKEIDVYREGKLVPFVELRRSVERNLRALLDAIGAPDRRHDFSVVHGTGRRRARQGVPLNDVLGAYRILFTAVWEQFADAARQDPDSLPLESLLSVTTVLWQLNDDYATALTESYRAAEVHHSERRRQQRAALLESLFTGQPVRGTTPWEVAKLFDLPRRGDLVLVAAEPLRGAEESLPGIERRLARLGLHSVWRMTPVAQTGVVVLREGMFNNLVEVLRTTATARTGVSPIYHAVAETARAVRLACAALHRLPEDAVEVSVLGGRPLTGLLAHSADEGDRIVEQVLGPVLALPAQDRDALLDTLQTWFDHDGSADNAAQQLYCHPNTVRYRLRRLHELTHRSLTRPHDVADLAVALEAYHQHRRRPL